MSKISKETLCKLYIEKEMSGTEMSKILDIGKQMVYYWLKKLNIPRRKGHSGRVHSKETKERISSIKRGKHDSPKTEFKKGQHCSPKTEFKKGNHPDTEFKKGGISPMKGKYHSEDSKYKMSISKKGQVPPNKGIPCPEETKNKISRKLKGRFIGEKSPSWKGGLTPIDRKIRNSTDYSLWRKICFERDNFICQKCKESGGRLSVHHINNFADFPELRFAIDNGVTLCIKCHKEFHKIYGKRNNTKEQLKEYLKRKV